MDPLTLVVLGIGTVVVVGGAAVLRLQAPRMVRGHKSLLGEAQTDTTDVDVDRDAMGQVVVVMEDISDDHDNGRIRFQGTTWKARSTAGAIAKGERAQLVLRDKTVWVVEPVAPPIAEVDPLEEAIAAIKPGSST
jgi:membrane protein implicated in regulation of membrane protease activity